MNKEDQCVVRPLIRWLEQEESWECVAPKHPSSARGWDIKAKRDNECLFIEAKYISGPAIAYFAGLVTAPLAKRDQLWKNEILKSRPWCCWAIGIKPESKRNMYQIMFDYMSWNSEFWKHYGDDLRMKYIFFVQEERVTRISYTAFLQLANLYADRIDGKTPLPEKRRIAEELLGPSLTRANT
jgi:hypothetical protein